MSQFIYPPLSVAIPGVASETTLLLVETNTENTVTELQTLNAKDFATQTTLAALNAKVTAVNTGAVVVSSSALPSGASTEATLASLNAKDFATQTTLLAVEAALSLTPVDQIDTTPLLDTSSSNIPASASLPLEVVASSAAIIRKVVSVDDVGEFLALYTGAASSEVLLCVLPLGGGEIEVNIPAATRISIRNMKNSAISSGFISLNFLG